ncbi:MAG: 30S ribosome-binding factor RbfA [Acidiferrobacterales bacterium]
MHSQSHRRQRVAELLKRELAHLIQHELSDPRVHGVTLTAAEVARDLSTAKIYLTCLAGPDGAKQGVVALNKASGFLRRQLRHRLVLRSIPQLHFFYDESVEKGAALSNLIDRAVADDSQQDVDQEVT